MSRERGQGRNAEQRMDKTAVANIDFRRLDQPFADIGMQRRQAAYEHQIYEQVDVTVDASGADFQCLRKR